MYSLYICNSRCEPYSADRICMLILYHMLLWLGHYSICRSVGYKVWIMKIKSEVSGEITVGACGLLLNCNCNCYKCAWSLAELWNLSLCNNPKRLFNLIQKLSKTFLLWEFYILELENRWIICAVSDSVEKQKVWAFSVADWLTTVAAGGARTKLAENTRSESIHSKCARAVILIEQHQRIHIH